MTNLDWGRSTRKVPARLRLLMRLDELDYHLPPEQIAQRPLDRRDASRLLLLNRSSGKFEDRHFAEFPDPLAGNELLGWFGRGERCISGSAFFLAKEN